MKERIVSNPEQSVTSVASLSIRTSDLDRLEIARISGGCWQEPEDDTSEDFGEEIWEEILEEIWEELRERFFNPIYPWPRHPFTI